MPDNDSDDSTDDNRVPISEMGIGDDAVEARLTDYAETFRDADAVSTVGVNTTVLDGVAHLHVTLSFGHRQLPRTMQNYIIAEGLQMFDPQADDDRLSFRLTTRGIYETWSGMDVPGIE